MYSLSAHSRKKHNKHWINYRFYSRQIISQPMNMDLHTSRVMTAMELDEKEPLQGALTDMFFGCWYDVPYFGERMLSQVKEKLNPKVIEGYEECINNKKYILESSVLATRWSVLVSPSMSVFDNQMFVSPDDSRSVAAITISALLDALEDYEDDPEEVGAEIVAIEEEFFKHCLTTDDRLAFTIVWWELSKSKWQFSEHWTKTRHAFEEKMRQKNDNKETKN
ncbi:hypothetical protein MOMA_06061 [Moraxella macacae 0408225]|uniref:Uncharacterized protein n=1 Tax=Moraxella macacae 0408225 TaxID=1230338 RepID=L2F517_9GAMM|nr:hypothetical protein [Moraxella macacae]ELA08102.1 hypothetical protein MOMA_06061 [Moraxella macacae 0408225]